MTLELPDDPDWPDDAGDVLVSFNDAASHELSDLVDETVVWLLDRPGVEGAVREDREFIFVWGRLDLDQLRSDLVGWWVRRLDDILNE